MICLIFGSQGSGKTLFLAKTGFDYYQAGYKVYSNFNLEYPHEELKFKDMMKCEYNNAVILLDEAHLWGLDARDGMSKDNKTIVKQFVVQVRKQGVKLYCASQRFRQLDIRLRENAEIVIRCKKYAMINKKIKEVFQSESFDKDIPIIIETELTNLDTEKVVYKRFIANQYYGLYNTSQVIKIADSNEQKEVINNEKKKVIKETDTKKVKTKKTHKSSKKKTKISTRKKIK